MGCSVSGQVETEFESLNEENRQGPECSRYSDTCREVSILIRAMELEKCFAVARIMNDEER